jgi:hypothetical protein
MHQAQATSTTAVFDSVQEGTARHYHMRHMEEHIKFVR